MGGGVSMNSTIVLSNDRAIVWHQTGGNDHYRIDVLAPYRIGSHERYYIQASESSNYEAEALEAILLIHKRDKQEVTA